ncbi:hypothetical protein LINPERHAP2_LOCUS33369 [Linum perenne]
MLWNEGNISVTILSHTPQVIHALVASPGRPDWILSAIYASPQLINRRPLWEQLRAFSTDCQLPWLVIGDLNEIINPSERRGDSPSWQQRTFPLRENVDYCSLIDLGWQRRDSRFGILQERLDRGLSNISWRSLFPEASILHLPRTYSDHCRFY